MPDGERLPSPELPPSPTTSTGPGAAGPSGSTSRLGKFGRKKAHTLGNDSRPPLPVTAPPPMPMFQLDTNLDHMEGIIAPSAIAQASGATNGTSSSSGHGPPSANGHGPGDTRSRYSSSSDRSAGGMSSIMSSVASRLPTLFSDPFASSGASASGTGTTSSSSRRRRDEPRLSPRSVAHDLPRVGSPGASTDGHMWGAPPPAAPGAPASALPAASSTWTVPEGWLSIPREPEQDEGGSGSEDEAGDTGSGAANGAASSGTGSGTRKPGTRRKTIESTRKTNGSAPYKPYRLRIYRANNTYHVVTIGLVVTVAELIPVLNHKLLVDAEREPHRLYIKERGRGECGWRWCAYRR
jgi:adenylate cyclase